MDRLTEGLKRLAFDRNERERMGANLRAYVEKNHDLDAVIGQFREVLVSCVNEEDAVAANRLSFAPIRKASQRAQPNRNERAETCVE
jgi:hypothetical protein